ESSVPLQQKIESAMAAFAMEERWESIILYSSEGLKMAAHGVSPAYDPEHLLEFAFTQIETVRLLGDRMPVKEIRIQGKDRRILVFRYFDAWGSPMILSAVLAGRKGYKRAMTRLIDLIQKLG
ncbi:hypothetical protein JW906_10355, partial [bacterium]|nr:hypothetical protein [bacterium]